MHNLSSFFIIFFLIFIYSCKNPTDSKQLNILIPELPSVSGIVLTDHTGMILGYWGSPNNGSLEINISLDTINQNDYIDSIPHIIPIRNSVSHPYPNPANQKISWKYELAKASYVASWISYSTTNTSSNNSTISIGQSKFYVSSDQIIKEIEAFMVKPAGYYYLEWDTKDSHGNNVSKGFYRIFTLIDTRLYWYNIFVYRDEKDLEPFFK